MRELPELEYLNGIPVDRDMANEGTNQNPGDQSATALAIQKESSKNVGDQVNELSEEDEESNTESLSQRDMRHTEPEIRQGTNDTMRLDKYLESLVSDEQSVTKNANILAEYLDTDELEAIAQCFDNIREMRRSNPKMENNNDEELSDLFDNKLTLVIGQMTEELQKVGGTQRIERTKAVIDGKRTLLTLLIEKTIEYMKQCDPSCGLVIEEITTQYESIIKTLIESIDELQAGGGRTDRSK